MKHMCCTFYEVFRDNLQIHNDETMRFLLFSSILTFDPCRTMVLTWLSKVYKLVITTTY